MVDRDDTEIRVRQARASDADAVAAFTRDTWSDREDATDYLPEVFPRWVETDGPEQRTFVVEVADGGRTTDGSTDADTRAGDASSDGRTGAGDASSDAGTRAGDASSDAGTRAGDASSDAGTRAGNASPDAGTRAGNASPDADAQAGNTTADARSQTGDTALRNWTVAGVLQGVLLSETEAWAQGMRVHPDYRGLGLSPRLSRAVFQWARDRGATVCRNMVFSWNVPGLGQSRSVGFAPGTEFRFARPEPDADAAPSLAVVSDAAAAWSFWTESAVRDALGGVALDFDESWSVSQLRERDLERAADEGRLFVVRDGGTRGFTVRAMTDESEDDGETTRRAIYAVAAWDSTDAADALVDAVARDAAELGADEVRVLVPEGVRWVSDLAAARCRVSEEPDFVMRADLTDPAVTADFSHD